MILYLNIDSMAWRLSNEIRATFEREQNENSSRIAGWLKSTYDARLVRIQYEPVSFFSVLYIVFSIGFCQNFFCLRSEVPSRDLNGDGGNRPCWIRICYFDFARTYPSKLLRGDMIRIIKDWLKNDNNKYWTNRRYDNKNKIG